MASYGQSSVATGTTFARQLVFVPPRRTSLATKTSFLCFPVPSAGVLSCASSLYPCLATVASSMGLELCCIAAALWAVLRTRFPSALEAICRSLDFSSRFPARLTVARSVFALLHVRMVPVVVRGSSMTRIAMAFVAHNRWRHPKISTPFRTERDLLSKGKSIRVESETLNRKVHRTPTGRRSSVYGSNRGKKTDKSVLKRERMAWSCEEGRDAESLTSTRIFFIDVVAKHGRKKTTRGRDQHSHTRR